MAAPVVRAPCRTVFPSPICAASTAPAMRPPTSGRQSMDLSRFRSGLLRALLAIKGRTMRPTDMAAIHSDEFKRDAVRIALTSGLTKRQVASDLGVGLSTWPAPGFRCEPTQPEMGWRHHLCLDARGLDLSGRHPGPAFSSGDRLGHQQPDEERPGDPRPEHGRPLPGSGCLHPREGPCAGHPGAAFTTRIAVANTAHTITRKPCENTA
jgi:hypothetical protein